MNTIRKVVFLFAAALMLAAGMASAQVAMIFEMTGTATATAATAAGAPAAVARSLRKGDTVNQSDSITTGEASTLVLRFQDGQIAALSARSTLAITTYAYNAAEPARSNVLLSLVNGGMRAITGLIGQARPQAVAYRAGNATIGIRGTDVTMAILPGANAGATTIAVTVNAGRIAFTLNGVTLIIPVGSGTVVTGNQTPSVQSTGEVAAALRAAVANNPALQAVANAIASLDSRAMSSLITAAQTFARARISSVSAAIRYQFEQEAGGGLPTCSTVVSPIRGQNCN